MLVMMKRNEADRLRSYIEENKSEFDNLKAPAGLWDEIDKEINKPEKPNGNWKIKGLVASILMIITLSAGYYWGQQQGTNNDQVEQMLQEEEALEFAGLPDFNETRQYYVTQVNTTWNELKNLHYDATLEQDLSLLDKTDEELKNELIEAEGIYKEHVLQAMIQNQQIKLNLLMDVLSEIKAQSSSQKSKDYESI